MIYMRHFSGKKAKAAQNLIYLITVYEKKNTLFFSGFSFLC